MKLRSRFIALTLALVLAFSALFPSRASAEQRLIVRTGGLVGGLLGGLTSGLSLLNSTCSLLGCNVLYGLDGTLGSLFLVTASDSLVSLTSSLLTIPGIVAVEADQTVRTQGAAATTAPPALLDTQSVQFYGATVRRGYVTQPAASIVRAADARSWSTATGYGITVAVIDTGIDPDHPALKSVLLSGYDYTRNRSGATEKADVSQSTIAMVDSVKAAFVNQSTIAMVDQSTIAMVDDQSHAAFGHGTMVAGVVHLVAPQAKIMPLKAFKSDGSGYASDILRATYYAAQNGAKVINMSFSFTKSSPELGKAVAHAQSKNAIVVASSGNDGARVSVYPASLPGVISVASSTNNDTLSYFSNYGTQVAFIAAPGEGIVTPYPFGTYAAAWGTSFSAPFASGAAALLADMTSTTPAQAADAEGHAVPISTDVRRGRLDILAAVQAR